MAEMKSDLFAGADRLDLIHTFVSIVESGSLSAVSVVLGKSQPTVTRRLQARERYLGQTLVHRTTHEVRLTEPGARVFEHARRFLETWDTSVAYMRDAHAVPRERLRLGMPAAYGHGRLLAALTDFPGRCPDVSVEMVFCDGRPNFVSGDLDCALQVGGREAPGQDRIHLAQEASVIVAAPGLWGIGAPPRRAAQLVSLPWLAARMDADEELVLAQEGSGEIARVPIVPRLLADDLWALRGAALHGLGACVLPTWIVADDLRVGRLAHLAPEWFLDLLPVALVVPRSHAQPRRLKTFIEVVRCQVPRLTEIFSAVAA